MLELILNGKGPRALVLREVDSILCTGAIVAEEFFFGDYDNDDDDDDGGECQTSQKMTLSSSSSSVPIICAVGEEVFMRLVQDSSDSLTIIKTTEEGAGEDDYDNNIYIQSSSSSSSSIGGNGEMITITKDLLKLKDTLPESRSVNDDNGVGDDLKSPSSSSSLPSEAELLAMRTIRRVASISGAKELIPITSAHIDAVTYIGPGGLEFAQRLVELGGKVKVKTTLNSQSCDRRRWKELGVTASLARNANSVGDAYLELGCEGTSFTCAPYLLPSRPKKGENIIWGESNAVVYSNSVIGARTEKYADYFDICAAIVGCVPNVGVHVEENRAPTIVIDATELIQDHLLPSFLMRGGNTTTKSTGNDDTTTTTTRTFMFQHGFDSFFPAMGWTCGNLSEGGIPLILGFDCLPVGTVSDDNLKAFCAAFGTTGSGECVQFTLL